MFTSKRVPGVQKRTVIFDETAPKAAETLASALHSLLTNPAAPWFALDTDDQQTNEDQEARLWLDDATRRMLLLFASPDFGFNTQIHEVYLDIVAFGTGTLFLNEEANGVRFQARPLSEIFIQENQRGMVDTAYRLMSLNSYEAAEEFGIENLSDDVSKSLDGDSGKRAMERRDYLHAVYPRNDRQFDRKDATNKPWASVYIDLKAKLIVAESGFDDFPYLTPRWMKDAGESYGRSPAMTVLPGIRMVNAMKKTWLITLEKIASPPLLVASTGIEGPINTAPNSIIYTRAGIQNPVMPLNSGQRYVEVTNEIERNQSNINDGFFLDVVGALPLQDRMTTVEVNARLQQRMTIMAPVLARLGHELLGPLIMRVFSIMSKRRMFLEMPDVLRGHELKVNYVSPLALSQRASEMFNIERLLAFITPFVQVQPEIMDNFDGDELVKHGAYLLNTPQKVMRSSESVDELRRQKADMAQQQADAEQAATIARAAKDGASAVSELQIA
jgi:hypothetical protein